MVISVEAMRGGMRMGSSGGGGGIAPVPEGNYDSNQDGNYDGNFDGNFDGNYDTPPAY